MGRNLQVYYVMRGRVRGISFLLRILLTLRGSKGIPARWYNLSTLPVELIEHHELLEENT